MSANILIVAFLLVAGLVAALGTLPSPVKAAPLSAEYFVPPPVTVRILNKTFASLDVSIVDGDDTRRLGLVPQESAAELSVPIWPLSDQDVRLVGKGADGVWMSRPLDATSGDLVMWDVEPFQRISHVRVLKRD